MAGLGLKFDTTALALAMSMVLMFVHFFVDRAEGSLLEEVDRRVEEDLTGRFPQLPGGADGQLPAIRRMAETMLQVTRAAGAAAGRVVAGDRWKRPPARWAQLTDGAAEVLKKGLVGGAGRGPQAHAQHLAAAEQAAAEQNRRHWTQVQQTQVAERPGHRRPCKAAMTRQAEVLGRAVEASGEVSRLEDALNRNLATLAGAKHFEQTVLGLAAAIHLLNARFSETPRRKVLDSTRTWPPGGPRGMKAIALLHASASPPHSACVSLFAFLAVLICTMGALMLLAAGRHPARPVQAVREAAAKAAKRRPT